MSLRLLLLFTVLFTACNKGIIPCPEAKAPKLKESKVNKYMRFPERSLAGANTDERYKEEVYKLPKNEPALKHVSVEEWDCPRPGKKNMPKEVRQNIRKNQKRVKSYYRDSPDSTEVYTMNDDLRKKK